MDGYVDELASKAADIALTHGKCREIISSKLKEFNTQNYSLRVPQVTLKPGRCEVTLIMTFSDSSKLEIMVDVDHSMVHYLKWYPRQMLPVT